MKFFFGLLFVAVAYSIVCNEGYTCYDDGKGTVWTMKDAGNVNGPDCEAVCETALCPSGTFHACNNNQWAKNATTFAPIAKGLGFTCKTGGCWGGVAPGVGMQMVSINDVSPGVKDCYYPAEPIYNCQNNPGNANCFGERYSLVCPCVPKKLDQACVWPSPPNYPSPAVWETNANSGRCIDRINYWRQVACRDGWVECPPCGLPPMTECVGCNSCGNSEAEWDHEHGAHNSFTRCGEMSQGEGGGNTCADVIDEFVSERAPDQNGIMRCTGHCGPIVSPGCQTFFWGRAQNSGFHTLNWHSCPIDKCNSYCNKPTSNPCYDLPPNTTLPVNPLVGGSLVGGVGSGVGGGARGVN